MLRLTLILCIGMYAALMIAGQDRGQLRPGLAQAAARGDDPGAVVVIETKAASLAAPAEPAPAPAQPKVDVAALAPTAEPAAPVVAEAAPAPLPEPTRTVVTEVKEPVFSLASVGNEAVPTGPAQDTAQESSAASPEVLPDGEGTIWYVNASSVNVRAEPSTDAEIVGRLGAGEATLVVQAVDSDWARIVIQGDGVEGFVAMRYLSAEAP